MIQERTYSGIGVCHNFREDLIGKTVLEFVKMPMEQREFLQKQAEDLLANGGMRQREAKRLLADDKVHDVLYWETAIELEEGKISGLVGVFVDISEQKALERELASAKASLEDAYDIIKVQRDRMVSVVR